MIGGAVAVTVTLAVANIMSNPIMSPPDVAHDTRALFSVRAAVVCANEIEPPNYKRTFRRTAHAHGYRTAGLSSSNPVAVLRSSAWRTASVRVRHLSPGIGGITPDRTATVVRLVDDVGHRLVVVCVHLVSRAWTHLEATTGLRRQLWREARSKIRRTVARWTRRGVPVIVLGDLNRPTPVEWEPTTRVLANRVLLQVAVTPPDGSRIRRGRGREISSRHLFTDHPIVRRSVSIRPVTSRP